MLIGPIDCLALYCYYYKWNIYYLYLLATCYSVYLSLNIMDHEIINTYFFVCVFVWDKLTQQKEVREKERECVCVWGAGGVQTLWKKGGYTESHCSRLFSAFIKWLTSLSYYLYASFIARGKLVNFLKIMIFIIWKKKNLKLPI